MANNGYWQDFYVHFTCKPEALRHGVILDLNKLDRSPLNNASYQISKP